MSRNFPYRFLWNNISKVGLPMWSRVEQFFNHILTMMSEKNFWHTFRKPNTLVNYFRLFVYVIKQTLITLYVLKFFGGHQRRHQKIFDAICGTFRFKLGGLDMKIWKIFKFWAALYIRGKIGDIRKLIFTNFCEIRSHNIII